MAAKIRSTQEKILKRDVMNQDKEILQNGIK